MANSNPSRRRFLRLGATGAIVVVVAGVGAYLALQPQPSPAPVATPRPPSPAAPASPLSPVATPSPSPAPVTPTPSPTPTPTISPREKMIADAKKEGRVNFYSSFDVESVNKIGDGFKKKYGIDVEPTGGEIQIRILAEFQAGKHICDTYFGTASDVIAMKENLAAPYKSPEADVYPVHLKDPEGTWVAVAYAPQTIAYNSNLVKGDDIPKSYWDLLKPRFKNKITLWEPRSGPHTLIVSKRAIIGEARWAEFVKGLKAQNPKVVRGTAPLVLLLRTGEAEVGLWVYTGTVTTQMKEGAPIDYVRRKGTMLSVPNSVWVYKFAPHPNAARLMNDYLLSHEGQSTLNDTGKWPVVRPGLPPKMGVGIGTGEGVTGDMVSTVWPFTNKDMEEASEEWEKLFERG